MESKKLCRGLRHPGYDVLAKYVIGADTYLCAECLISHLEDLNKSSDKTYKGVPIPITNLVNGNTTYTIR